MHTDLDAIQAVITRSQDAWNSGDGPAYGRCFTADATEVTFAGTVYRGGTAVS